MNLIKFNNRKPAVNQNYFDEIFNGSISNFVGSDFIMNSPALNVSETEAGFIIELAAPGLDKNDFKIAIEKEKMVISASTKVQNENTEEVAVKDEVKIKFTRREFNYTSFKRSFQVPMSIDNDAIEADYINGVLTVTLPKKEEVIREEKGRSIEVK